VEGILKFTRKTAAIVQRGDGWYGLSFTMRDREISDLTLVPAGLDELKGLFQQIPHCIAFEDKAGYLFQLKFPFADRRKIGMVIRGQLEEVMPFSIDDMVIDFEETGGGRVLAAGLPKSRLSEVVGERKMRAVSFHSLAAMKALRWFGIAPAHDFVFLDFDGDAVVIMAFKGGALKGLRQFFQNDSADGVAEALKEMLADVDFSPEAFIMVDNQANAARHKAALEQRLGITITVPSLKQALGDERVPEWMWAGVGAALIALYPGKEVNLSGERRALGSFAGRLGMYAVGGLAALSLIVCGLLYLDYFAKEQTLLALNGEPNRLYRLSFPKSPPVKDPARMFQEKIKALEREGGGGNTSSGGLGLFNEISARVGPDVDVKLSEFTSDEREFSISGTTISFGALEKIKSAVGGIEGLSGIELQSVDLAGGRQVKFKLRGKL
jgi:hypothetical protein